MTFLKTLLCAVLYTGALLGASPALADRDPEALRVLRSGDMKKLIIHDAPQAASGNGFETIEGAQMTLADLEGKLVLLNFWATWCAPCRHEMPALNALQKELGGDSFAVVTLATGFNPPPAIASFFDKEGIDALPRHRDPTQAVARDMAVFGLPTTVLLNEEGQEIARLRGDADWFSDDALALLRAFLSPGG